MGRIDAIITSNVTARIMQASSIKWRLLLTQVLCTGVTIIAIMTVLSFGDCNVLFAMDNYPALIGKSAAAIIAGWVGGVLVSEIFLHYIVIWRETRSIFAELYIIQRTTDDIRHSISNTLDVTAFVDEFSSNGQLTGTMRRLVSTDTRLDALSNRVDELRSTWIMSHLNVPISVLGCALIVRAALT